MGWIVGALIGVLVCVGLAELWWLRFRREVEAEKAKSWALLRKWRR